MATIKISLVFDFCRSFNSLNHVFQIDLWRKLLNLTLQKLHNGRTWRVKNLRLWWWGYLNLSRWIAEVVFHITFPRNFSSFPLLSVLVSLNKSTIPSTTSRYVVKFVEVIKCRPWFKRITLFSLFICGRWITFAMASNTRDTFIGRKFCCCISTVAFLIG